MKSNTKIKTNEAKRISRRLFNHWKHKFEVNESDHTTFIYMPDATVQLDSHSDVLEVTLTTDREDFAHLEQVIIAHLNRMAQQEFDVEWLHQS